MRWGLLSTARINDAILAAAAASATEDVVAVGSRDHDRARAYAAGKGIARAHGSYEALLADPEVDAVYISLPNGMHHEWTLRTLEAGKHVLCEKPYTRRPGEVDEAFDAAGRAGLVLMEAFMWRHHPQVARLRELLAEGAVGRVRAIRAVFSFFLGDDTNIRAQPALDGGSLMDVGCYCVSGSRLVGGEPEWALAAQVTGPTGIDRSFHGTLGFADEVVAQFHSSFALPERQALEVFGEKGTILLEAPWRPDLGGRVLLTRGGVTGEVAVADADSYRLELENMSAAARGEAAPLLGREDALGQAHAIDALYRAAESGRREAL